jgi:hypothetical protein
VHRILEMSDRLLPRGTSRHAPRPLRDLRDDAFIRGFAVDELDRVWPRQDRVDFALTRRVSPPLRRQPDQRTARDRRVD